MNNEHPKDPAVWLNELRSSDLPSETKKVGVILTAVADDEGKASPGVKMLARHTELPESAVTRALRDLKVTKRIEKIKGRITFLPGSFDRYRLTFA